MHIKQFFLSYEEAHRLFRYDPGTGKLFNRVSRGTRALAGAESGSFVKNTGYRQISCNGFQFAIHRVIWLMVTGIWPESQIDHIDGDKVNNRIDNLRNVTNTENQRNSKLRATNTSGISGVCWDKKSNRWVVQIGKRKKIGGFNNLFEAACARKSAERAHGYHINHGRA